MSIDIIGKTRILQVAENIVNNKDLLDTNTIKYIAERYEQENKFTKDNCSFADYVIRTIESAFIYGYVANVTAFNFKYQENYKVDYIDLDLNPTDDLISDTIEFLLINISTSYGNYFISDWYVTLLSMLEADYKEYDKELKIIKEKAKEKRISDKYIEIMNSLNLPENLSVGSVFSSYYKGFYQVVSKTAKMVSVRKINDNDQVIDGTCYCFPDVNNFVDDKTIKRKINNFEGMRTYINIDSNDYAKLF